MGLFKSENEKMLKELSFINDKYNYDLDTVVKLYLLFDKDKEFLIKFVELCYARDIYLNRYENQIIEIIKLVNDKEQVYELLKTMTSISSRYDELIYTNAITLLNCFSDKNIVINMFSLITNNQDFINKLENETVEDLFDYIIESRKYYVDERASLSSFVALVNEIDPNSSVKVIKKVIKKKIDEDKKMCGIYNVDQFTLSEIDRKLSELGILSEKLTTLVSTADKQIKLLKESLELNKSELNKAKLQELESLRSETVQIVKEFNEQYLELLAQERTSLINEKEQIISSIHEEIQKRILDLTSLGDQVSKRVSSEIGRIRTAGNDSIIKMNDFLSNNENIKRMIEESQGNEELIVKLQRLDEITSTLGTPTGVIPGVITEYPSILIPNETISEGVNYYFDESIPFKTRFEKLMELKEKDIKKTGAIYHEKFNDVLTMILENKTPYMYGPSGCGKTFMIESQIAKLLGLPVTTNGYVLYEQDILGYTNSGNGVYVPSNFYRAYKNGHIIFFDELDNGIANATVVLNRFIGSDAGDIYVFPNGEPVRRHPNFRIVSAGNSNGAGKTLTYNTRQKMDESVMQRVTPVEVSYDNRIEEQILVDYPGWYNFAVNFRKALESINNNSGEARNSIGTFTTRDAATVKKYLDDGSFDDEKIMLYEIIENKNEEYLETIKSKMTDLEKKDKFTPEGKKILSLYKDLIKRDR